MQVGRAPVTASTAHIRRAGGGSCSGDEQEEEERKAGKRKDKGKGIYGTGAAFSFGGHTLGVPQNYVTVRRLLHRMSLLVHVGWSGPGLFSCSILHR